MNTLIVAGGEIKQEQLIKYCEEHRRPKYHCC